jgi:DNA-directed RNA polymerase subunit RPC12/RpoP
MITGTRMNCEIEAPRPTLRLIYQCCHCGQETDLTEKLLPGETCTCTLCGRGHTIGRWNTARRRVR